MTHEEIAEQLYDELQHNKIVNYNGYSDRLYELLGLSTPERRASGRLCGRCGKHYAQ